MLNGLELESIALKPIGLSLVRLLSVKGNRVLFLGADMLDGSPLLDIKPYYPKADQPEGAWGGWTEAVAPEQAQQRGRRLAKQLTKKETSQDRQDK